MIAMLTQGAFTLVAWFILMLVCTNLVGFLVRGFFPNPKLDELTEESHEAIEHLVQHQKRNERKVNFVALVAIIFFLLGLYYFWNIGLVAAALMLMTSRISDLIWEIRNGRQLQIKDMKRPSLWFLNTALSWLSLPVTWYALYRM